MLNKIFLGLIVLLTFFTAVNAESSFFSKAEKGLEGFYNSLKDTPAFLDAIAVIFFAFGIYTVFFNLTRFAFKGEGSKAARKATSIVLAIFVTGAMIMIAPEQGFVGYYGGIVLFFLIFAACIGGMVAYYKFLKKQFPESKVAVYSLLPLGLIPIDLTLTGLMAKLFGSINSSCRAFPGNFTYEGTNMSISAILKTCEGVPSLIVWIVAGISNNLWTIVALGLVVLIFWYVLTKIKGEKEEPTGISKFEKEEKELDKKEIASLKGYLGSLTKAFKEFDEHFDEHTYHLKGLLDEIKKGGLK